METEGIVVGGKTGTAQVVRLKQYQHLKEQDIPYKYRDHAWFTCYAPAANPEIAVTVLVEHGLHGGSAAAPIASKIMTRYFNEKRGLLQNEAVDAVLFTPQMLDDASAADEPAADPSQGEVPTDVGNAPLQF